MEKVANPLLKKYPIMRLYKSDLEKIFNLFKDQFPKLEIVADGFKLNDFSELSKINKQEIVEFKITGRDPYLQLDFSRYSASIYLSDEDDIKLRGLADKIGDILSDRKSYLRFFANPWSPNLLTLIWIIFVYLSKTPFVFSLPVFLLFVCLWLFWGFRIDTQKHSLIYLYDHSSASNFLKRNKDNILLSVLSALIGGIITLAIAWALKKI